MPVKREEREEVAGGGVGTGRSTGTSAWWSAVEVGAGSELQGLQECPDEGSLLLKPLPQASALQPASYPSLEAVGARQSCPL